MHGAGSARWGFALLRPLLERALHGHRRSTGAAAGDSGDGEGPYAIESEFEDVAAVVRDAGKGALLFGHSYGALVAAGAAPLIDGLPEAGALRAAHGRRAGRARAQIDHWESLIENGDRDCAVSEFLAQIGGYSADEIEQMQATPAWELRMQAAPTLPRELRAEHVLRVEQLGLGLLAARCCCSSARRAPSGRAAPPPASPRHCRARQVRTLEGQGHGGTVSAPDLVAGEIAKFLG